MITIKRITIKNFRSIVNETIVFSDFNCFVGKNDSGKSNVLKALNLFFNGKTDFDTDFDFQSDYSKFAKRGAKQAKEIVITVEVVIPDTYKEKGTKIWKKVWRTEGLHYNNFKELFGSGSKGFTLLERIKYLYIPAVKSNAYFKDLLSSVYESMMKSADSALKDLNQEYSEQLQALTGELSWQIRSVLGMQSYLQMPSNLTTLFRDLTFSTSDKYVEGIDLNHRGDGIKARHIPLILRYMQRNTEKGRPKNSVSGSYIWGFEEPENGLEYLSCYEMAQEFYSYISDCQILLTTHSPAFYSQGFGTASKCFFVEKNYEGASKYVLSSTSIVSEKMGLMQLVAPIIANVRDELIKSDERVDNKLIGKLSEVANIMRRAGEQLDVNQVLSVIEQYASALDMLDDYDHQRLKKPQGNSEVYRITYDECKELILKMRFSAESDLFGNEKDDSFRGSIGNIYQTFGGVELYPSVEEKAANLLYFVTKNHSFSDGNKRIAAAVFLYFLEKNDMLFFEGRKTIEDHTLVAIIVMIAESHPDEKETMISLVMNFLKHQ